MVFDSRSLLEAFDFQSSLVAFDFQSLLVVFDSRCLLVISFSRESVCWPLLFFAGKIHTELFRRIQDLSGGHASGNYIFCKC